MITHKNVQEYIRTLQNDKNRKTAGVMKNGNSQDLLAK